MLDHATRLYTDSEAENEAGLKQSLLAS